MEMLLLCSWKYKTSADFYFLPLNSVQIKEATFGFSKREHLGRVNNGFGLNRDRRNEKIEL